MSSEEVTAPADAPQAAEASESKSSSRTRPSSTVAASAAEPKKKIARPSTGGAKKATGGAAAKKTAGNGEPKSFKVGDVVLARLKGFPQWPARIADPEEIPVSVKAARPNAGRPMGATTKNNLHVVEFFPAGDFSWIHTRDIEYLSPKAISEFLAANHRRTGGDLKRGYEIAQDPTEWDVEQQDVRKAQEDAANQVDELEDDDEEADVSTSKRKKATKEKSKKKAKVSKAEVEDEEDAPAPKATKSKTDKVKKPAAKAEAAPADDDPLANDPECVKVKDWRHKLQRAFLGKAPPSADEMPTYDTLFTTIEEYKNITIDALTYSKIGKVMKKIGTLSNVARNEEFKITDRANKLMTDWANVVDANKPEGANGNGNGEASKETAAEGAEPEQKETDPAVNGTGEGEGAGEKTEVEPTA